MRPAMIFAGGGTGGHIFPALATARRLKVLVLFVGSSFGMERTLVPANGFPFKGVPVKGFIGVSWSRRFVRLPLLTVALAKALFIFMVHRPRAVLGFGGYASLPSLFWARLLDIPYFLQEQNAVPGAATRMFAPGAKAVFSAFPGLPVKGTVILTGNPVREEIRAVPALEGVQPPLKVFILGGSQGSSFLNRIFTAAAPELKSLPIVWVHQTGKKDCEQVRETYLEAGLEAVVEPFIDRIWETYAWAHLLVCRAGAMTVSEAIASGRPALFIPFAGAANNHQVRNAAVLTEQNAGFMQEEKNIGAAALAGFFRGLLENLTDLAAMSRALKSLDNPGGMETIRRTVAPYVGGAVAIS